jgi:hypothetical protein
LTGIGFKQRAKLYLAGSTFTIRPIMPRLLIVNCTHDPLLQRLAAVGSRPYDKQFIDSVSCHLPAGQSLEAFTLNIGDGDSLPQGVQLGDFDGAWLSGSPLNVYRLEQPTVREQLDLARAIWQAGVPAVRFVLGTAAHDGRAGRHGASQSERPRDWRGAPHRPDRGRPPPCALRWQARPL